MAAFWTSRCHRSLPILPRYAPSFFMAHKVQNSHCSSICFEFLPTRALALLPNEIIRRIVSTIEIVSIRPFVLCVSYRTRFYNQQFDIHHQMILAYLSIGFNLVLAAEHGFVILLIVVLKSQPNVIFICFLVRGPILLSSNSHAGMSFSLRRRLVGWMSQNLDRLAWSF